MRPRASPAEVRARIDRIDGEIVRLPARGGADVRQAARCKTSRADVAAPERARQVVARARPVAEQDGTDPDLEADL